MPEIPADLRRRVRIRAAGMCEYCRISEELTLAEHEVDHIIAVKHGGPTSDANLALCYTVCNRYKGSDISSVDTETGQLTPLFHPRQDRWSDHFVELGDGTISGLTAKSRATVQLLKMNRPSRLRERRLR